MKKVILFSFSALAFVFMSCKKNYTCTCTYTDTTYGYQEVTTRDISKTSKKNAEAICGDYTTVYTDISGSGSSTGSDSYAYTCVLK